ncbi:hypothetical protein GCM10028795_02690 [Lysobacter olei]
MSGSCDGIHMPSLAMAPVAAKESDRASRRRRMVDPVESGTGTIGHGPAHGKPHSRDRPTPGPPDGT